MLYAIVLNADTKFRNAFADPYIPHKVWMHDKSDKPDTPEEWFMFKVDGPAGNRYTGDRGGEIIFKEPGISYTKSGEALGFFHVQVKNCIVVDMETNEGVSILLPLFDDLPLPKLG